MDRKLPLTFPDESTPAKEARRAKGGRSTAPDLYSHPSRAVSSTASSPARASTPATARRPDRTRGASNHSLRAHGQIHKWSSATHNQRSRATEGVPNDKQGQRPGPKHTRPISHNFSTSVGFLFGERSDGGARHKAPHSSPLKFNDLNDLNLKSFPKNDDAKT